MQILADTTASEMIEAMDGALAEDGPMTMLMK